MAEAQGHQRCWPDPLYQPFATWRMPPSRTASAAVPSEAVSESNRVIPRGITPQTEDAPVWWMCADIAVRRGRWWRLKASVRIFRP
jgi:hypothetical protein